MDGKSHTRTIFTHAEVAPRFPMKAKGEKVERGWESRDGKERDGVAVEEGGVEKRSREGRGEARSARGSG